MFNFRELFKWLFRSKEPVPVPPPIKPPPEPPIPEPNEDVYIATIINRSDYDKIITTRYILGGVVYSRNVLLRSDMSVLITRQEVENALGVKDINGFKLKVYSDTNTHTKFLNGYTAQARNLKRVSEVIDSYIGNADKVSLYYQQKDYPQYYQFTNNPTCGYLKTEFYYILEFVLMTIYNEFLHKQANVLGIGDLGPRYYNSTCRGHQWYHSGSSNQMDLHYYTQDGANVTQANYSRIKPTDIYINTYLNTASYDWERSFALWNRLLEFFQYSAMVDSRIEAYTFDEARKIYGPRAVSHYLKAVISGDPNPQRYNHDTHSHFNLNMSPRYDYMYNSCVYDGNKLIEYTVNVPR